MDTTTTSQRELILRLLREAELDTRTVTYQHRQLGVAEHEIGGRVDTWLDALSMRQASDLIEKLQGMVS